MFRRRINSVDSRRGSGVAPAPSSACRAKSVQRWSTFSTIIVAFATVMACGTPGTVSAENSDIVVRRASQRTSFNNDEIKDGFFKTAFRAELQFDRPVERIRKFDDPVRVFVVNRGKPDRSAEIAAIVADIRAHVNHLDVAMTADRAKANLLVMLVQTPDFARTIRSRYGAAEGKKIQNTLQPQCLSGIGKDQNFRIRRAEVILPVDAGEFQFYDCAYEEMLQALGLINDDSSVPWTMFNDDVQMGFFDIYDQYLVNMLYDPRVRPGMTKSEVDKLLPDVLPTVRAWVANANSEKGQQESRDGSTVKQP
jgi:hypothetical protein